MDRAGPVRLEILTGFKGGKRLAEVTIRALRKSYGGLQVIHGLDLDIPDGAFVVLVGPSGCGKSTLLRMIAGLEDVSGGDVMIGDNRVNNLPPSERDIAMVFQNYALYPHKTVAANMGFALKMRGMDKEAIRAKVEHAAGILGLTPYLDRYPRALSGGQRQRVGAPLRRAPSRPTYVTTPPNTLAAAAPAGGVYSYAVQRRIAQTNPIWMMYRFL